MDRIKIQILLSLSKEIYLSTVKSQIVIDLSKNGITNFKEINEKLQELVDEGYIEERNTDYYGLNYTGIKYLTDNNLNDNIEILIKLMNIHQEFTNISKKIQTSLIDAENRVQQLTYRNQQLEIKLNSQVEEVQSMKTKYIEILGIFIAIFSILGFNLSFLKETSEGSNLVDLLTYLLTINGVMLLSIVVMLIAIKSLILNEFINKKKLAFFSITPSVLLILGMILSVYK